ncbi:hypothetical protein LguiB_013918 [Lonicera macranthoides]
MVRIPQCYTNPSHRCKFEMKCSPADFTCDYCFTTISLELFMVCIICKLHYHEDCWRQEFRTMYENKYDHILDTDIDKYYQEIDTNRLRKIKEGKRKIDECPPKTIPDIQNPLKGIEIKEQNNLRISTKESFMSLIEIKILNPDYPILLFALLDTGCTTSICKANAFPDEYYRPSDQLISGRVANGDYFELPLQTIPIYFQIGDNEFTHEFYVMDPPCKFTGNLLIGNDFLKKTQPFAQYDDKIELSHVSKFDTQTMLISKNRAFDLMQVKPSWVPLQSSTAKCGEIEEITAPLKTKCTCPDKKCYKQITLIQQEIVDQIRHHLLAIQEMRKRKKIDIRSLEVEKDKIKELAIPTTGENPIEKWEKDKAYC